MSPATIESYLRCAQRFAEYQYRSPCAMGAPEVRAFLVVARMPRMRVPMHIPLVLTIVAVSQLLAALKTEKHRAMLMLAHGAGLRVSEVCTLRVQDIDPKRMLIHVRHAKRGRYVMLSPKLLATSGRTFRHAMAAPPCVRDGAKAPSRARRSTRGRHSARRRLLLSARMGSNRKGHSTASAPE